MYINHLIPRFLAFAAQVPDLLPKFYWDVYSAEERVKRICLIIKKLTGYCEMLREEITRQGNAISEFDGRLKPLEDLLSDLILYGVVTDIQIEDTAIKWVEYNAETREISNWTLTFVGSQYVRVTGNGENITIDIDEFAAAVNGHLGEIDAKVADIEIKIYNLETEISQCLKYVEVDGTTITGNGTPSNPLTVINSGTGLDKVYHDSSLLGDGTPTSPLIAIGGGSGNSTPIISIIPAIDLLPYCNAAIIDTSKPLFFNGNLRLAGAAYTSGDTIGYVGIDISLPVLQNVDIRPTADSSLMEIPNSIFNAFSPYNQYVTIPLLGFGAENIFANAAVSVSYTDKWRFSPILPVNNTKTPITSITSTIHIYGGWSI